MLLNIIPADTKAFAANKQENGVDMIKLLFYPCISLALINYMFLNKLFFFLTKVL